MTASNQPEPAEAATEVGADDGECTEIDWRFVKFCAFVIGLAVVVLPVVMLFFLAGASK